MEIFPLWYGLIVFFVIGACVGSFYNVVVYRMPRGISLINPPSHCPLCKKRIPLYLNLPIVGWLILRGKSACSFASASRLILYFGRVVISLCLTVTVGGARATSMCVVSVAVRPSSSVTRTTQRKSVSAEAGMIASWRGVDLEDQE